MLKKIATSEAPAAIGPYSQGIVVGNMLYASGQIPINPESGEVDATDISAQATQVMKNIAAVLKEAGATYKNIVKTTCFLQNMEDFAEFNTVYASFITHNPARSCVAVKELPKKVLCEVEIIAYLGE
ncbi:MAG: RidA family protein [Lachnospiraceae bacterium]